MTIKKFIRKNRQEIDRVIRCILGDIYYRIDDEERRLWILNDESLYRWARTEGVRL
jgi:hypothetical protein